MPIRARPDTNVALVDNFQRQLDSANTIDQLEELRVERVMKLQSICAQLSERDKKDENGNRLDGIAFHTWRQKTVYAKMKIEQELMRVKLKLKLKTAQRGFNTDATVKYETTDDLLHAALVTVKKLAVAFELSPDEQKMVDDLQGAIDLHLRTKAQVRSA